jgi:aromatic-amino-acid transaminase
MFDGSGAGGGGDLDVEALDRELTRLVAAQKRVLLFINDPCHNPTGYSMRADEWKRVVSVLEKHAQHETGAPITLLVDMAYSAYAKESPRAFLSELQPLLGKVLITFAWSASKTFTHYGLRVGALVCCAPDEKYRQTIASALSYSCRGTWSNCNRGGLAAVTRLLKDPQLSASCTEEREQAKRLLAGDDLLQQGLVQRRIRHGEHGWWRRPTRHLSEHHPRRRAVRPDEEGSNVRLVRILHRREVPVVRSGKL